MSNTIRFATFVFALLAGCKPAGTPDSNVKTLDALAGTERAPNVCKGNSPSLADWRNHADAAMARRAQTQIKVPTSATAAVDQVFTSIPEGIVRTVLLLGYEIQFTNDPVRACAGIDAGALTDAHGCAKTESVQVAGGLGEKVTLILSADPKDVAHSTLTGVMTLVSQKLGRIAVANGSLVLKDDDDQAMVDFRRDLSAAVLHDAAQRGLKLAPLASLLPRSAELTAKETTLARRRALWDEFATQSADKAAAAESMIFANTGDSYHCSTGAGSTRERFAAWATAAKLWTSIMVPDLEALANLGKSDAAVASNNQDAPEGFGLWGRWGGGNGPLRQMFSNRIDDTGYAFPRANGLRRAWDGSGGWYSPPAWGEGRLGWRLAGDTGGDYSDGYSDGYTYE